MNYIVRVLLSCEPFTRETRKKSSRRLLPVFYNKHHEHKLPISKHTRRLLYALTSFNRLGLNQLTYLSSAAPKCCLANAKTSLGFFSTTALMKPLRRVAISGCSSR